MPYATITDVHDYTSLADDLTDADLQTRLDRATTQIDGLLVPRTESPDPTTGLVLTPALLTDLERAVLTAATCAQTEYRILMGERFFVKAQRQSEKGPDFEVKGSLPRIGPKVWDELRRAPTLGSGGGLTYGRAVV